MKRPFIIFLMFVLVVGILVMCKGPTPTPTPTPWATFSVPTEAPVMVQSKEAPQVSLKTASTQVSDMTNTSQTGVLVDQMTVAFGQYGDGRQVVFDLKSMTNTAKNWKSPLTTHNAINLEGNVLSVFCMSFTSQGTRTYYGVDRTERAYRCIRLQAAETKAIFLVYNQEWQPRLYWTDNECCGYHFDSTWEINNLGGLKPLAESIDHLQEKVVGPGPMWIKP